TQPASGETYPKSDLFNKAVSYLTQQRPLHRPSCLVLQLQHWEVLLVERMVVITAACLVWVRWVWQLVGFMVLLLEPLPVQFLV
ncbi:hypothetical protein QP384_22055, partial [Klebsiella pneumoniae]|uniref:hypothetical protein n=1 Tax=Klebsiella pneumoniae TaxID=573 RepID=UPI0025538E57